MRRSRPSLAALIGAGLLAALLGSCASDGDAATKPEPAARTATASVGDVVDGWTRLPDWPLPPRTEASAVWTGDELLVVGGRINACPPGGDCMAPTDPPLSDGAALDPDTGTWRAIADAPVPLGWLETAVAGGDVYVLQHAGRGAGVNGPAAQDASFLRYSPADDAWTELPLPSDDDSSSWYTLVAAGADVIAGPGSDENGVRPVRRFDASSETWSDVPDDPLPDLFDRSMSFDGGYLYLTGLELSESPGSDGPTFVLAARYDLDADRWEELPTSESISSGLWPAGHGKLVNPALGGADGGEVNGWGRWYPEGAVFDAESLEWEELPRPEGTGDGAVDDGVWAVGLINGDATGFVSAGGWVYDGPDERWVEMPEVPGGQEQGRSVVAAGPRAVAYGGGEWKGAEVTPFDEIWMWTPPD